MDALYGEVLAFVRALREAGREESSAHVLHALTDACNPREVLDGLRWAVTELPPDEELGPDLAAIRARLLAEVESEWRQLP
jgi:hypothetical protein